MKQSVNLLSKYVVNGVLSMRRLKQSNLRMLKYLQSNLDRLSSLLLKQEIEVLNDLGAIRETSEIKLFMKLHYGHTVNLTDLRKSHRSVYRVLSELGKPRKLLEDWGFNVVYQGMQTEDLLIERLQEYTKDGKIVVPRSDRELYNKVMYWAGRHGLTVTEYLKSKEK